MTLERDGRIRVTVLTFPEGKRVKAMSAHIWPSWLQAQLVDLKVIDKDV